MTWYKPRAGKRPQLDYDDIILRHDNPPAHQVHDTELDIALPKELDLMPCSGPEGSISTGHIAAEKYVPTLKS